MVAVGGSVTTGMGAARREDAYLSLVVAWLRSLGDEAHPVRVQVPLAWVFSLGVRTLTSLNLVISPSLSKLMFDASAEGVSLP